MMRSIQFSKHASMELSINTIVVLVIAIAVLGLGLAFTKNMFSKFKSSFSVPTPEYDASSSEPIVFSTADVPFSKNQDTEFPISIYNTCPDALGAISEIDIACDKGGLQHFTGAGSTGKIDGLMPTIASGTQAQVKLVVKATDGLDPGRTACILTITKGACKFSKTFYANIQS